MRTSDVEELFRQTAQMIGADLPGLGVREEDIPSVIKDVNQMLGARLEYYRIAGTQEADVRSTLKGILRQVKDWLKDHLIYYHAKKDIRNSYQQTGSWLSAYLDGVDGDGDGAEAFIDCLEEIAGTQVRDVAHLQELTGIQELDKWDRKKGAYVDPETKQNAIDRLTQTLTGARGAKYQRALDEAIRGGAKYKDLLGIKPADYGLPESWSGTLATDQYTAILWAIDLEFMVGEPAGLWLFPDLRSIALELEAPYSVLMDCYKLSHKGWG
jgi:hypothetical protein